MLNLRESLARVAIISVSLPLVYVQIRNVPSIIVAVGRDGEYDTTVVSYLRYHSLLCSLPTGLISYCIQ